MEKQTPFFVVATLNEAEKVKAEGFKALPVNELETADCAVKLKEMGAGTAIIVLNADTREDWAEAFDEAGVPYRIVTDTGEYSDAFTGGAEHGPSLGDLLQRDYKAAYEAMEADALEAKRKKLLSKHVYDVTDVAMGIYVGDGDRTPIPTGIKGLDDAIGGGLPQGGLTVLGAGSSNGKTTMAVQWADHIAASGFPVLFVTIEQGRHEIVAKSLSRMMRLTKRHSGGGYFVASMGDILNPDKRTYWGEDHTKAFFNVCSRYSTKVAPHMHIMEMSGQPTMKDIRAAYDAVAEADRPSAKVAEFAPNPILFVDYLQLVGAKDERMTERKAIDVNVMELRQLARDKHTAVVVISSINRQSYAEGADMSAFKESGAIEFSADLALMLQPRDFGASTSKKSEKEARDSAREAMAKHKSTATRQSELVVLKNRAGATPSKPIPLMFDAMCNLFTYDSETVSGGSGRKIPAIL